MANGRAHRISIAHRHLCRARDLRRCQRPGRRKALTLDRVRRRDRSLSVISMRVSKVLNVRRIISDRAGSDETDEAILLSLYHRILTICEIPDAN